jgi:hypothetical protein
MSINAKSGLDALLTPDNCVLILIDHQPFQFAGLRSHDTQTIINNVVGLAKSAKVFERSDAVYYRRGKAGRYPDQAIAGSLSRAKTD